MSHNVKSAVVARKVGTKWSCKSIGPPLLPHSKGIGRDPVVPLRSAEVHRRPFFRSPRTSREKGDTGVPLEPTRKETQTKNRHFVPDYYRKDVETCRKPGVVGTTFPVLDDVYHIFFVLRKRKRGV